MFFIQARELAAMMTHILCKNRSSKKHHRRVISVSERAEKKGFYTHTQKRYIYIVKDALKQTYSAQPPEIFVTKVVDSKNGSEIVLFRIKGVMSLSQDRHPILVHYCHALRIHIRKEPQKV